MSLSPVVERSPAVAKRYLVTLTDPERQQLKQLLAAGKRSAKRKAS